MGICKHVGASLEESLGVTWGYHVVICLNSKGLESPKSRGPLLGVPVRRLVV